MAKLLSSLSIGTKIKDSNTKYYGNPIIWQIADKNHEGYPMNSITLITEKIICLKAFDGKEPSNPDTGRKSFGNNNYRLSNLLQWLNSQAGAGRWYSKQHSYDTPPINLDSVNFNGYEQEAGFLHDFSANFIKNILDTTTVVIKNTIEDGGGAEGVTSKMFLASTAEVGAVYKPGMPEGSKLALFEREASRTAKPTVDAISNNNYSNEELTPEKPWSWWLRTPMQVSSCEAHRIRVDNEAIQAYVNSGNMGVRPLCNLPSEILVSDLPDTDGIYEIIWNSPPIISGKDEDLGVKTKSFSYSYSVLDEDGTIKNITEKLNSEILNKYDNPTELTRELNIDMNNIPLWASNTIEIIATDDVGATTTRTLTFTRGLDENVSLTDVAESVADLIPFLNGKQGLIRDAITNVDDSVVIPTDATFNDLASAIGKISTGKKWATGTVTPTSASNYTITVNTLSFKPSIIITQPLGYEIIGLFNSLDGLDNYLVHAGLIGSNSSFLPKTEVVITSTGFYNLKAPNNYSVPVIWWAIE